MEPSSSDIILPPIAENAQGDSDTSIVDQMESCYLDYAMSVIVSRALPDVRDGLKPVHRRILYAMHDAGVRAGGKYRKSARVVGDVLGRYHPHGDSSVYDATVRMAQDFSMRYPLVDGQGNFGSMDGDGAAAMRYTEVRLEKIAELLLEDIDKETVDWRPNYDASTDEPTVLPARIPNLLINGVSGIAVGMATNIAPHNLTEICQALLFLLVHEHPESVSVSDLMAYIHGPDFPTGGIVYGRRDIEQAYATGRGSVVVRGRASIEEENGKRSIIITEVPYQLNKSSLITKIAELVQEKTIVGISDIRDESNKESVRVVIDLKRDAFPKKVLNQLYQLTSLQTSFAFNMVGLTERGTQPKLFNLLDILLEFLAHRQEVVVRRTAYELAVAEARLHILQGLKIALDHIEEVIKTIRAAATKDEAGKNLMAKFGLSEKQTQAILEMQLQRLAGLEREKIENELAEKTALVADLKDILATPARVQGIIGSEIEDVRDRFGDARRTEVVASNPGEWNPTDTIPNESVVVSLSRAMYAKRVKSSAFRTQKRGGKGLSLHVREEDEIDLVIATKNHNRILFFTDTGRVFACFAYEIPEVLRTAKGQPVVNLLALQKEERVAAMLDITAETAKYLVLVSLGGIIKRIELSEIRNLRASGLIVAKPKEGDAIGWAIPTDGSANILMVSKKGKAIQFGEEDVRVMGRAAAGVKGMKLSADDGIVEATIVRDLASSYVFTVSAHGIGKLTSTEEYREQGRGGSGIKASAVTPKTGDIVAARVLSEDERKNGEAIIVASSGQTIRIPLAGIRLSSRVTQGVMLARLSGDDIVSSLAIIGAAEEEGDAISAADSNTDDDTAVSGRASIEEENGKRSIIITEVPYQLNKSSLITKVVEFVQDGTILGISDIRDESNKESVRVVIDLKPDALLKKVVNQLSQLTLLQISSSFGDEDATDE